MQATSIFRSYRRANHAWQWAHGKQGRPRRAGHAGQGTQVRASRAVGIALVLHCSVSSDYPTWQLGLLYLLLLLNHVIVRLCTCCCVQSRHSTALSLLLPRHSTALYLLLMLNHVIVRLCTCCCCSIASKYGSQLADAQSGHSTALYLLLLYHLIVWLLYLCCCSHVIEWLCT